MRILLKLIALSSLAMGFHTAQAEQVEVGLAAPLGEDHNSNYCIDIPGGNETADPTRDVRAYTCYTYRDTIGYDHAMDSDEIAEGQFRLTGFDVCLQAYSAEAGSALAMRECDSGNVLQNFDLQEDKTIRPRSASNLCLTVGDEVSYGRNGPGGHEIRPMTLEQCSDTGSANQKFVARTADKTVIL